MRRVNLLRAHGSPTGYQYYHRSCHCVSCRAARAEYHHKYYAEHREEKVERDRKYYVSHAKEITEYNRQRKYGISTAEWDAMLVAQGNGCAICKTAVPGGRTNAWHTDHDHDSGLTRGILCHHCNTGLGSFQDDPAHLMAAIEYLAAATP